MTEDARKFGTIHSGMIIGHVRRYTVAEWLEIAALPDLSPAHRANIEAIAELREAIDAVVQNLLKESPPS